MAASIHKRAAAARDLVEHYVYLAENAGIDTAERFLLGAEKSFYDLSQHPEMGAPISMRPAKLAGLRRWPVTGFGNILIFYLPRGGGARDWWNLLGVQ